MKSYVVALVCLCLAGCSRSESEYVKKSKVLEVGGLKAASKLIQTGSAPAVVMDTLGEPDVVIFRGQVISAQDSEAGDADWQYRMWVSQEPPILGSMTIEFHQGKASRPVVEVPGERQ